MKSSNSSNLSVNLQGIPEDLKTRLESLLPGWLSLINQDDFQLASNSGLFDEVWLIRHLQEQLRISTYKEITEKGEAINSGFSSEQKESATDALRELGIFISEKANKFLEIKESLEKIIKEHFWKNLERDPSKLKEDLYKSVEEMKSEFEARSEAQELEIVNFFGNATFMLKSFSESSMNDLRPLFESQMKKFKEENRRAMQTQQKFLSGDFSSILDKKTSSLDDELVLAKGAGFSIMEFDTGERLGLELELEKIINLEIETQRKLRTESVNEVLFKAIGKSGSEEIISFLNESKELSSYHKKVLSEVVNSGYLLLEDEQSDFVEKKDLIVLAKDSYRFTMPTLSTLYEIARELNLIHAQNQAQLDAIYDDSVYRFCNGGWWAALAHIGTAGFCSGWTLAANLHSLILGRMVDMKSLLLAIDTIIFFVSLPYRITWETFIQTGKIGDLIARATVEEIKKRVKNKVKKEIKSSIRKIFIKQT